MASWAEPEPEDDELNNSYVLPEEGGPPEPTEEEEQEEKEEDDDDDDTFALDTHDNFAFSASNDTTAASSKQQKQSLRALLDHGPHRETSARSKFEKSKFEDEDDKTAMTRFDDMTVYHIPKISVKTQRHDRATFSLDIFDRSQDNVLVVKDDSYTNLQKDIVFDQPLMMTRAVSWNAADWKPRTNLAAGNESGGGGVGAAAAAFSSHVLGKVRGNSAHATKNNHNCKERDESTDACIDFVQDMTRAQLPLIAVDKETASSKVKRGAFMSCIDQGPSGDDFNPFGTNEEAEQEEEGKRDKYKKETHKESPKKQHEWLAQVQAVVAKNSKPPSMFDLDRSCSSFLQGMDDKNLWKEQSSPHRREAPNLLRHSSQKTSITQAIEPLPLSRHHSILDHHNHASTEKQPINSAIAKELKDPAGSKSSSDKSKSKKCRRGISKASKAASRSPATSADQDTSEAPLIANQLKEHLATEATNVVITKKKSKRPSTASTSSSTTKSTRRSTIGNTSLPTKTPRRSSHQSTEAYKSHNKRRSASPSRRSSRTAIEPSMSRASSPTKRSSRRSTPGSTPDTKKDEESDIARDLLSQQIDATLNLWADNGAESENEAPTERTSLRRHSSDDNTVRRQSSSSTPTSNVGSTHLRSSSPSKRGGRTLLSRRSSGGLSSNEHSTAQATAAASTHTSRSLSCSSPIRAKAEAAAVISEQLERHPRSSSTQGKQRQREGRISSDHGPGSGGETFRSGSPSQRRSRKSSLGRASQKRSSSSRAVSNNDQAVSEHITRQEVNEKLHMVFGTEK